MIVQPISTHQCYGQCNCQGTQKTVNSPGNNTKVCLDKTAKDNDRFERSDKNETAPKDDKIRNRMFGVMFSSGGGTN